jgi:hypothetical protein
MQCYRPILTSVSFLVPLSHDPHHLPHLPITKCSPFLPTCSCAPPVMSPVQRQAKDLTGRSHSDCTLSAADCLKHTYCETQNAVLKVTKSSRKHGLEILISSWWVNTYSSVQCRTLGTGGYSAATGCLSVEHWVPVGTVLLQVVCLSNTGYRWVECCYRVSVEQGTGGYSAATGCMSNTVPVGTVLLQGVCRTRYRWVQCCYRVSVCRTLGTGGYSAATGCLSNTVPVATVLLQGVCRTRYRWVQCCYRVSVCRTLCIRPWRSLRLFRV